MTVYSYAQLEGLWIRAGGSPSLAPLMAAIAEAESGGNSLARNPSGASGLWQILGNPFPGNAFDPFTNARMAVAKYKSQGLTAWQTYTNGAYKAFLKGSVPPNANVGPGSISTGGITTTGFSLNPLGFLPGLFGLSDFKDLAERAGLILFGAGLIILGIVMFSGPKLEKLVTQTVGGGNAAKPEGTEDKASNGEGVREEEGRKSVLRNGEQGQSTRAQTAA